MFWFITDKKKSYNFDCLILKSVLKTVTLEAVNFLVQRNLVATQNKIL